MSSSRNLGFGESAAAGAAAVDLNPVPPSPPSSAACAPSEAAAADPSLNLQQQSRDRTPRTSRSGSPPRPPRPPRVRARWFSLVRPPPQPAAARGAHILMSKLRPGDYETIPPGPTAAAAEALYAASAQRLATATMASLAAADDFELPGGGRLKPRGVSSDSFERRVVKETLRTSGITGGGSRTRKTSRYNSNSPGGPPRLRLVSRSPGHRLARAAAAPPHPGACPFTGCRPRALLYHAASGTARRAGLAAAVRIWPRSERRLSPFGGGLTGEQLLLASIEKRPRVLLYFFCFLCSKSHTHTYTHKRRVTPGHMRLSLSCCPRGTFASCPWRGIAAPAPGTRPSRGSG